MVFLVIIYFGFVTQISTLTELEIDAEAFLPKDGSAAAAQGFGAGANVIGDAIVKVDEDEAFSSVVIQAYGTSKMYLSLKPASLLRTTYIPSQLRLKTPIHNSHFALKIATMSTADNQAEQKLDKSTSEEVWKTLLSAEEYRVLRQKGTEPPGTGKYDKFYEEGEYKCAACNTPLYTSEQKFNSGCGWPAFYDNKEGAVERNVDRTHGMTRTEIVCSNCGAHLGHVFQGEGFPTPTNERHCVNSVSLKFQPKN